ncbi:MAG: hypothetical protein HOM68_11480 [Gemmatimonadetes bacterium]|jgi:hypothetical protein|nr:hypothetical protein [Gemmatimonadota bacterium]MBT4613037.1 hypothetical protein [Gemmatimonadota bacterium]MBT5057151.1 hypothetical protein [Gemmatimonadota bacterium]MBT5145971.1 hypothetical protein [Gemmatimonadota bacterium]MBT5588184.1 hypothetical protein [Gemmatimonadota bacterium]
MNRKTAAVATLLLVCAGCDVPYVDTNIVSYDDSGFDREAFLMVVQGLETTQIDGVVMGSADSAFAGRVLITKKSDPQRRNIRVASTFTPSDSTERKAETRMLLAATAEGEHLAADFTLPAPGKPGVTVVQVDVVTKDGSTLGLSESFNIVHAAPSQPVVGDATSLRMELSALAVHGNWSEEVVVIVLVRDSADRPVKDQKVELTAIIGGQATGRFRGSGIVDNGIRGATGTTTSAGVVELVFGVGVETGVVTISANTEGGPSATASLAVLESLPQQEGVILTISPAGAAVSDEQPGGDG